MVFTQEDFKKIEEYLRRKSVKDTEFKQASIPLTGTESFSIVQNGENKKLDTKSFSRELGNLAIPDFINLTANYGAVKVSLEEAIQLVPLEARKVGQYITFQEKNGFWGTYQYVGDTLVQWNIRNLWEKKG